MSVKLKITLWFTAIMLLLSAVFFTVTAMLSGTAANQTSRRTLTSIVNQNLEEIEYDGEDRELDIDDDFVFYRSGIYTAVLNGDGAVLAGGLPSSFLLSWPFSDGAVQEASSGSEHYLVYDRSLSLPGYGTVWIRAAASADGTAAGLSAVSTAALIALPLLVLLAAGGGYLLAGRSLRPIQNITRTAGEISRSGDLKRRIRISNPRDELGALASTFNQMLDRLEQNFEAERQFTSDASHELRTPVAVILAQCEYALENARGEEELCEAISAIERQGRRISRLIESLLSFTRLEQGTAQLNWEQLDLSALTASVCREQKDLAIKQISLETSIQPGIRYRMDETLFSRLLVNLIQNAYRYGKEKGRILVSLFQDASSVYVRVSDDGIGIAPEELPKIWNRFYRSDPSRSAGNGGLGLGLPMVKQIAGLCGGDAWAESEPGTGSVFTVRLPRNPLP